MKLIITGSPLSVGAGDRPSGRSGPALVGSTKKIALLADTCGGCEHTHVGRASHTCRI
ncbi:hypothetical protein [Streptomyces caniscabiei]|uniref:hypothetical protein n=1 Tax=Streptomyces caniscabiei TaxID=2746961 RepID=UPI000AEBDE44|nr:hypothetical protein [Streptomyces caniscabiei]